MGSIRFTILYYRQSGSLPISALSGTMAGLDINTLTMEQYLALSRENQAPGMVKPEIGGNVNFEIKSQFQALIEEDQFSEQELPFTLTVEPAKRWVTDITPGLSTQGIFTQKAYNPKVNIFYKGYEHYEPTNAIFAGGQTGMTPAQASTAIQTMTDHSQKWHDGTTSRNVGSNNSSDGLAALVPMLNNLHGVSFISETERYTPEVLQHQLPPKKLNPGSFTLPCTIEIDKLADEYELGIGNKGHILDNIWEYCKQVHNNNYGRHNHGFEVEEREEMGGQSFVCVSKDLDNVLLLGRKNESKFKEMIRKECKKYPNHVIKQEIKKWFCGNGTSALLFPRRRGTVYVRGGDQGSKPINRGHIQAIPTSLPPQPIGEATKAYNLQRIPPGVQGRSHFTNFLYLIVQIQILFTILYYPRSGSLPVSAWLDMEYDVDISAITIKQYIALIPDDIKPDIVNPKIGDDIEFEINSKSMRELRRKLFAGTNDEDTYEHVRTVLEIVDLFHFPGVIYDVVMLRVFPITLKGRALRWKDRLPTITTWDLLKKDFIWRYCHPFITAKKLEEIRNFKQERDQTLYYAWERYNDLLYQCPLHDLNCQQKVHIFYTRLDIPTRKILDSNRFIPLMTPTQALESIQAMADHSHNWYDETTTRERINDDLDNVDAIHASFKREHLTKECSLEKENEAIKHSRYMESLEETIIKFCEDIIKK
ncbi:ribonuclease H-like domain-containing protein [Tanacetum coccineum]